MIYISSGADGSSVINLTRGDDATLVIELTVSDNDSSVVREYVMDEDEYLIFSVREKPSSDSPLLLELRSQPGLNEIDFTHDDTADLEVNAYSAEIQLMTGNNQRYTVWPKLTGNNRISKSNRKNFYIMSEVVLA